MIDRTESAGNIKKRRKLMMWEEYTNGQRMYSLNLAAFLLAKTDLIPDVLKDEATNTAFFIFPECHAIRAGIRDYKTGNPEVGIRDFLSAIKKLRTTMNEVLKKDE